MTYNTIFLVLALWSTLYAFWFLYQPGISQQVRSLILGRHVTYIVFFFVVNLYWFAESYYWIINDLDQFDPAKENVWWQNMLKVLYYCQGIIMPLLRLSEPLFFQIVK